MNAFLLFVFLLPLATHQQALLGPRLIAGGGGILQSSCFSCSQAIPASSFQFASSKSSDHACSSALMLAELDLRSQCGAHSCSESQAQGNTACGLSLSDSRCRFRMSQKANSSLWMCSVSCEGSCACQAPLAAEVVVPATTPAPQAPTTFVNMYTLNHTALGLARMDVSEQNQTITVIDIGSSGNDGVRIDLPVDSQSHSVSMQLLDTNTSGVISYTPVGRLNRTAATTATPQAPQVTGLNGNELWTLSITGQGNGTARAALFPAGLSFQTIVVEAAFATNTNILGSVRISVVSASLEPIVSIPVTNWTVTPFLQFPTSLGAMIKFDRSIPVTLFTRTSQGAIVVQADRVMIRPVDISDAANAVEELTATLISAANMPSFIIYNETFVTASIN